jgi:hypothetical protein
MRQLLILAVRIKAPPHLNLLSLSTRHHHTIMLLQTREVVPPLTLLTGYALTVPITQLLTILTNSIITQLIIILFLALLTTNNW